MGKEKTPSPLTSFSSEGDRFAILSADGIAKVWDTSSGKIVAEWKDTEIELKVSYSCIACSYMGKKHKKNKRTFLLALGTTTGDVLAIDFNSSKRWEKRNCNSGEITALAFASNGCILYTAGTDGVVTEMNSATGETKDKFKASKRPVTSLSISHDEKMVVVASKTMKLFNLDDKRELFKIPSDIGLVRHLAVSDDGKVFVSSVSGHKQLQIWSCDLEDRSITARAVLSMPNQPKMLQCRSSPYIEGILVLSVSEKGVAYIWHLKDPTQDGVPPTKILVKSEKQMQDEQRNAKRGHIPIISSKLCDIREDKLISVRITYGQIGALQFKIAAVSGSSEDIYLTSDSGTSDDAQMTETRDGNATDGGGQIEMPDLQGQITPKRKGKAKRLASDFDSANKETLNSAGTAHETVVVYNLDGPTMEEKLASMDLVNDAKQMHDVEKEATLRPPSADSVHVLLKQALHADDHSLLLDCLYTRDEKVIAKSISLLTPADALKLLKSFILMIQSRGAVLASVLPWLKNLLCQKASSIVAQDSSLQVLNTLYQHIDTRMSTFGSTLQLSTRLDYLFSGIPDDEADEELTGPPIIYEDKDTDEEGHESEDAMETEEDDEDLGGVIDVPNYSDGSEVMSD